MTSGLTEPNYTQVPNMLFEAMPSMSEVELKCTLAIVRQIIGWHKDGPEAISYRQLEAATGLSRPSVVQGVSAALERGYVKKVNTPKGKPNRYTLNLVSAPEPAEGVSKIFTPQEVDQEGTSQKSLPQVVKNLNSHSASKEKKEKKQQQQLSSSNESEYQDLVKEAAATAGSEDPCPPDCDRPNAFALFEDNISIITPIIADELRALLDEFPESWVENAIKEGARNGAKTVKYIRRVLERWRKDGPPSELAPAPKVYEGRGSSVPPPGWKPGEFLYVVPDIPLEEEWDRGS